MLQRPQMVAAGLDDCCNVTFKSQMRVNDDTNWQCSTSNS